MNRNPNAEFTYEAQVSQARLADRQTEHTSHSQNAVEMVALELYPGACLRLPCTISSQVPEYPQ